jgi:threonine dehydratase
MTSSRTSDRSAPPDIPSPGLADIEQAREGLRLVAVVTPLLRSTELDERTGGRVLIKPEVLQRTGSFKFRGAYNKISRLGEVERRRGVVAFSSGNHAQGVAAAARLLGAPATIVMPADAPAIKVANTRALGAEVVLYDRARQDREAIAAGIVRERGATLVRPYDDPDVIAGQGTIGLEIADQAAEFGLTPDLLLAPCGGGGLISGLALAIKGRRPQTEVIAVEPVGFDDTGRSLRAGERVRNALGDVSFCDALMAPTPGLITFAINRRLLSGGVAVTDEETATAMAFAFRALKLVVEPGGAVALAAVLTGKISCAGRVVALVLSGGNVDPETFAAALARAGSEASTPRR